MSTQRRRWPFPASIATCLIAVAAFHVPHGSLRSATANEPSLLAIEPPPASMQSDGAEIARATAGDAGERIVELLPAVAADAEKPQMGRYEDIERGDLVLARIHTNVSAGRGLNDWERAKLELARAAVSRAEAEGSRSAPLMPNQLPRLSVEEAEARKLERLRASDETHPTLIDLLRGEHGQEHNQEEGSR